MLPYERMHRTACPTLWVLHDYDEPNGQAWFKLYKLGGGALFGFTAAEGQEAATELHAARHCPCWCQRCGQPMRERSPDNPEWTCPTCD